MAGAANWWDADAHAPSITGVIPAAPRKPSEILRDTRTSQEIANNPLDVKVKTQSLHKSRTDQALSMAQDYNSNPDVKAYNSILPTYAAALESPDTPAGDQGLVYAMAKVMQADGSAVRSEEVQNTESLQPYIDQVRAQYGKQMKGDGTFLPTARQQIRAAMAQKMAFLNRAYINQRVRYKEQADRAGLDPRDVVGDHTGIGFQETEAKFLGHPVSQADYRGNIIPNGPQTPPNSPTGGPPDETGKYDGSDIRMHMDMPENAQGYRFTPSQEAAMHEYLTSGKATPQGYGQMMSAFAASQGVNVDDAYTQSATANGQRILDALAKGAKLGDGMTYNRSDKDYRDSLLAEQDKKPMGDMATGQLLTSGATAGLNDEASGVIGGAKSFLEGNGFQAGYRHDRDTVRAIRDRAYEERPIISGATEMLGAFATPGGAASEAMRGGKMAERMAAMAKAGGRQGIAAGYGYGEGAGDSIKGAAIGGATGALIGGVMPVAAKGVSSVYNFATKRPVVAGAQNIADAAAAENIPISRPFLDPSVRNKMTYLDTTAQGAPVIQGALADTANAIETRAASLGKGGNAVDAYEGGQAIQKAGKNYITRAKSLTDRLYQRARDAVPKGMEIEPVQALKTLDAHIAELNKSPSQNASEIKYLQAIRSDLTKQPVDTGILDASGKPIMRPGEGLSIDTIRNMRTNMRGQISERNLTLSKAESRVVDVLGSASRDIQTQLAEKAPMAGARYARADAAFKGKQEKIKNVIQTFLGPRLANIPPEQAFSRLESMARSRGNSQGLQSMVGEMDKSDVRDIAATFADSLGKDASGDFSPARFIAHAAKLSPRARRVIFGDEGAETINNLVTVSNAYRKVAAMANHSGTERARNYKGAVGKIFGFFAGTSGGYAAGGGMGAMVGGMAATQVTGAVEGMANARSARLLMSPDVAKWLKATPSDPAAIEAHIARLSTVAAREPAISGDVISLQNYLASKFSESPSRAAATPGQDRNDRRPPPENNGQ